MIAYNLRRISFVTTLCKSVQASNQPKRPAESRSWITRMPTECNENGYGYETPAQLNSHYWVETVQNEIIILNKIRYSEVKDTQHWQRVATNVLIMLTTHNTRWTGCLGMFCVCICLFVWKLHRSRLERELSSKYIYSEI